MMLDQRFPWLWALILAFMVTQSSPDFTQIPSITDPKFIQECVDMHNQVRTTVEPVCGNMKYMSWDPALAKSARAWAKRCVFQHNSLIGQKHECHPTFSTVGENLWMGKITDNVVRDSITDWYNESRYFELATIICTTFCGHYTQVVWATTYKVGCALKMCPNLGKDYVLFVCDYAPAGNLVGIRPYQKGLRCNHCPEDHCENNLCRNPARDKVLSYPYWNPRWEFPRRITCNPFCQVCVSLRLGGMALATVGVIVLQRIKPHMHLRT
ncbi:GLIPR1-like protein 1 [Trichosurus vulpecula]|uniref:GLIPR1-like protein 1 n=1 Tax=Trichosurus vulpecula TaxID=9337 RepID=UPI00186AD3D5|nr:GLIPR1-like protein 1 [Trichosurus vulpecula]